MSINANTPRPATLQRISDIPRYWAEHTPEAPALWEQGVAISFRMLAARIDADMTALRTRGVIAGDRVMLVAENCADEIAIFCAAAEIGAWPTIVNARMSQREIDVIREHSEPRVQLYTVAVSTDATAHARHAKAVPFDEQAFPGIRVSTTNRNAHPEPADIAARVATLIYTSGTTGAPKGVMLTHSGLLHFCQVSSSSRSMTPADQIYAVLPFSHIFGIATIMLTTLYAGASLWIEPRFDPAQAISILQTQVITTLQGVPMLWRRLLAHLRNMPEIPRFPYLRYLYIGGGGLEPALKERIESTFGLPVHHGYGMTEYAGSMFITPTGEPRSDCSSGRLNPGCEARFVDEEGRDVAPQEVGEIWVRGPGNMLGYYKAPELTREVLRPDGWLRTGDLGRLDPSGALFVVGRKKELIKRAGFNVFPIEVESVLNSHPAVRLAAVLGRPTRDGDEEVIAFVEPDPSAPFDEASLKLFLVTRLAPYKRPSRIIPLALLPTNANGKVRKPELQSLLADVPATSAKAS